MGKAIRRYVRGPAGLSLVPPQAITYRRPPPAFLVEGLIRAGAVVLLAGHGGGGKSWLALDLVVAVDTGKPWVGAFPVKQGRALYLDWESGEDELCRRLRQLFRGRGVRVASTLHLSPMTPLSATRASFEKEMIEIARENDLIVIDSLCAASTDIDENASEIRTVLDVLRRTADKTGCSIVVVHHARKGTDTKGALRDGIRGSSAIVDAVDAAYVAREVGGHLRVQAAKVRFGEKPTPFSVKIEDDKATVAEHTERVTRLTVVDDEPREGSGKKIAARLLAVLPEHDGASGAELRKLVKARGTNVDAALKRLEKERKIVRKGTDARPTWHLARRKKA